MSGSNKVPLLIWSGVQDADTLRKYRADFILSQDQLAHLSGVDVFVIKKIEQKLRIPTYEEMHKLSEAFRKRSELIYRLKHFMDDDTD